MTMHTEVDDGDAKKTSPLHTTAKMRQFGTPHLDQLDNVVMLVRSFCEKAAGDLTEVVNKRDALKESMHRNEGALGVIQSVSTQLENAKASPSGLTVKCNRWSRCSKGKNKNH